MDKEEMRSRRNKEPLSPAARLFHSPTLNCYIIAILGSNTKINPTLIKAGLQQSLINHPRFSSKLVTDKTIRGKQRWVETEVNLDNHVIVPDLDPEMDSPDQFVEDYMSNLTTQPMELSRPLWEVHILNTKTTDAEALAIVRIHHSIGDGMSLMSLVLACTRKISDPEALPTLPVQKKHKSTSSGLNWFWWFILAVWLALRIVLDTIVDVILFAATALLLKDTSTPIKGAPGVEHNVKRFVHKTVSLNDVKLVKSTMNMTVNDVLLGVTQAGLSRYLSRRYEEKSTNLPRNIRLRASVLVNIRPAIGIQALTDMMSKGSKVKWGNKIGYILLPFNIALRDDDPLACLRGAKATMDRKKKSLEAICSHQGFNFVLQAFGVKAAAAMTHKVLSNTTMSFSSMTGPVEEISFFGHPVAYIAPSVYGHPQSLTIHFQSYADKITISIAADPSVIPDPHQLRVDLEESLQIIKDAVLKEGLVKETA